MQAIIRGERNAIKSNQIQSAIIDIPKHVNFNKHTNQKSLIDQLRTWVLEYHLTHRAVSSLLKILNSCGMSYLPKDCRTLLSTPEKITIETKAGGQIWYNGIRKGIKTVFPKLNSNLSIELHINADGLPLFKSSPLEFWPLLASIRGDANDF